MPVSACTAMVNAPTANTSNIPKPATVQKCPVSAPSAGPAMTAPPMPEATA
jgi:hypothetical protein